MKKLMASALLCCSLPLHADGLQPLDDEMLADVTGQEGVSVRLELLINAFDDGTPLNGVSTVDRDVFIDCADPSDPCRFALEFAGREDKWLVFKGYSGILRINDIRLDAMPQLSNVGSNPAYFNASKFQDAGGACLIAGGTCTSAGLGTQPALQVSYPATTPAFNAGTNTSTGFDSLEIGIRLDGIAAEEGAGAAGYLANARNPFLGFNVRDVNGPSASMAIGGEAYVFGF